VLEEERRWRSRGGRVAGPSVLEEGRRQRDVGVQLGDLAHGLWEEQRNSRGVGGGSCKIYLESWSLGVDFFLTPRTIVSGGVALVDGLKCVLHLEEVSVGGEDGDHAVVAGHPACVAGNESDYTWF
jgi:hypothetical protein